MRSTCDREVISRYVISVKEKHCFFTSVVQNYIWCWRSTSVLDRQTDRQAEWKKRACFQRQARAYSFFLMGQKETVPCRVVVFIQPDLGLWCFSFVICVLDELHLIESSGNVLLELLKLFCSIYCFSLTKNIIQNLVSCPPRQHF